MQAQASALSIKPLADDEAFARAIAETFPNDEFATKYVNEVLAESKDPGKLQDADKSAPSVPASRSSLATGTMTMASFSKGGFPPRAGNDTTCDGVDDDADEEIDEDCDFGPADCPRGSNVITGTGSGDWIWGTSGPDCILGYGGRDVLLGLEGNDLIVGGPGDDAIRGGKGDDQVLGSSDDDLLYGDENNDFIDGGDGNDAVAGAKGNDKVYGGLCHDLMLATSGTDGLHGDNGSDRIEAGFPHAIDGGGGIDACDGTSCELASGAGFCLWDGDCSLGKRCTRMSHICVSTAVVAFTDVTCNGADDDCDGRVDEDYAPVVVACPCGGGSSVTACVDGEVVDECSSGGGSGTDATCDGIDDDCDAHIDEDYVSTPSSCGVGACAAGGSVHCVSGSPVDSCLPLPAAVNDATCNGIDDDCNGASDEDFVASPSACGVGVCSASGLLTCVSGGVADSCTPGAPAPSDATCDNLDDDCSGAADEDYIASPTSCDVAGCFREGELQCSAGVLDDTCSSSPCVGESACDDDLDNDADDAFDCDDADCSSDPFCEVQPFGAVVLGSSSMWGAGHASAPGGGSLPPVTAIALGPGAIVRFTSVTGLVNQAGANLPPDGLSSAETLPSSGGLAGFTHNTLARSLAAVFLNDTEPLNPAPAPLAFANGEFTVLAPGLRQIFFIGDGVTSGAVRQRFAVPAGATRLFLGLTDRCSGNIPGCFGDNTGSYSVTGEISYE